MNKNQWLGDKSKQGFYKKTKDKNDKRVIEVLNLNTMQYAPKKRAKLSLKLVSIAKASNQLLSYQKEIP